MDNNNYNNIFQFTSNMFKNKQMYITPSKKIEDGNMQKKVINVQS